MIVFLTRIHITFCTNNYITRLNLKGYKVDNRNVYGWRNIAETLFLYFMIYNYIQ